MIKPLNFVALHYPARLELWNDWNYWNDRIALTIT